ncbi:MAG TPA: TldD/PmbA family protein [Bryobacteraceae bacterium]|nr:TldD/PmbA family protein [Bryobacteraceae bacterium]
MVTRRTFLQSTSASAAATRLFAAPAGSTKPNPELENLAAVALQEAKKLKACYCDIRIIRYRRQNLTLRLNPERGTGNILEVPVISDGESFGFGVRVIAAGAWGFAASPLVTKNEIARITREAVAVARANSAVRSKPVQLAPVQAYKDRWQTPHERDPFAVPIEEKLALIRNAAAEARKGKQVFSSGCNLSFRSEDKYFASSEGSSIQQLNLQTFAQVNATAVDVSRALSRTRRYVPPPVTAGYEYVPIMNLVENARRLREEVVEHLKAPPVSPGRKDLVLLPNHLWLTIHESIGHSTELDRALGFEANFAGTSFLTPDKLGKQRIGSDIVNVWGDRTTARGLATTGYDDDGVKASKFPIVEKGVFTHYQTIRDQAHWIGEKESRGCCYADSWSSVPFQRMPNVWLEPGNPQTTLDDLISGVEDGILIDGDGSFSIDQQRYNFQFGGDVFWTIKGGKRQGMVSRVAYQARTPDFWQACDSIAGPSYWQQWGAPNDGKGEPPQSNSVSHGCSPARFRQINVIQTD